MEVTRPVTPISVHREGKLKVGIVSGILHPRYGGPVSVIAAHVEALEHSADISVFGVKDAGDHEEIFASFPGAHQFRKCFPRRWFRGKGIYRALQKAASDLDILHAHMVWDFPVFAAWEAAKNAGKPFIVTPHGSLMDEWRHNAQHKRLYKYFIAGRMLREATCVHVLNRDEEMACRDWGVTAPIRVIPNGLPIRQFLKDRSADLAIRKWPILSTRKVLIYVGRLWSGKGLDVLVDAWAEFRTMLPEKAKEWILVLAGPDYRGYGKTLERSLDAMGTKDSVVLTGHVSGELKESLLAHAQCFILPSRSEGFSIALLEAMAAGLPALYTTECHFKELAEAGGGLMFPFGKESLVDALVRVCELGSENLKEMGRRGRRLGMERYTLDRIGKDILAMYNEAVGRVGVG